MPSAPILIRPATSSDSAAILRLAEAMHSESARRGFRVDQARVQDEIGYHIHRPQTNCGFLAEVDNVVVGFLSGWLKRFEFSSTLRLCSTFLYVAPAFRGSYAFLKLLRSFESWGRAQGAAIVQVGMSGGVNSDRLLRLFSNIGYQHIGNTLTWKPARKMARASALTRSPVRDASRLHELLPLFRDAHRASCFRDIVFEEDRFRSSLAAHLESQRTALFELKDGEATTGLFATFVGGYATNDGRALRCVFAASSRSGPAEAFLEAVHSHLTELSREQGTDELFWLTVGAERPSAVLRRLRSLSYENLGGTFIKSLLPSEQHRVRQSGAQ